MTSMQRHWGAVGALGAHWSRAMTWLQRNVGYCRKISQGKRFGPIPFSKDDVAWYGMIWQWEEVSLYIRDPLRVLYSSGSLELAKVQVKEAAREAINKVGSIISSSLMAVNPICHREGRWENSDENSDAVRTCSNNMHQDAVYWKRADAMGLVCSQCEVLTGTEVRHMAATAHPMIHWYSLNREASRTSICRYDLSRSFIKSIKVPSPRA